MLAVRVMGLAGKFIPALGWIVNRIRFPSLHCGLHVEIMGTGRLVHGNGTRIGAFSRFYLDGGGSLFLGNSVGVGRDVHIQTSGDVRIGARTGLNDGARINGSVAIGRYCAIGPNLNVSSGSHLFRSAEPWKLITVQERENVLEDRPVTIGDDCWIGTHVAIMRGITIGRGAVIGANAVVTRDVPPYAVMAGVPARQIGERMVFKPPLAIEAGRPEDLPYFYSGFEQLDSRGDGFPCDSRFFLALDAYETPDAWVELTLSASSAGTVAHGIKQEAIEPGTSVVRFPLVAPVSVFHEFRSEGDCRLVSARIIGFERDGIEGAASSLGHLSSRADG